MSEPSDICGLTRVVAKPLERTPLRRREDLSFTAGWRLEITCDQGKGGILPVPLPNSTTCYRGDGCFLAWDQKRLGEIYTALTAPDDKGKPDPELQELGNDAGLDPGLA